jgi:DNA-binding XRE family transcriptional regulator
MSKMLYIGAAMSFEEKRAWIQALVPAVTYAVYVSVVLWRAGDTPLTEVAYATTLLVPQADLADRLGVTRQIIIAIEKGRYSPSLEMAFQIAGVFKVPLDEVFQYSDNDQ